MQTDEQQLLARYSDEELDALAQEIDRVKPWRGIGYAFLYFFRRWTITIWMGIALYFWDLTSGAKLFLFAIIFFYEWRQGKVIWDINVSTKDILTLIKTRELPRPCSTYALVKFCVLVTLCYIALYFLKEAQVFSLSLSSALSLLLLFLGFNWLSNYLVDYYLAGCRKHNFSMSASITTEARNVWEIGFVCFGMCFFFLGSIWVGAIMLWIYHWLSTSLFNEIIEYRRMLSVFGIAFLSLLPSIFTIRFRWTSKTKKIISYIRRRA